MQTKWVYQYYDDKFGCRASEEVTLDEIKKIFRAIRDPKYSHVRTRFRCGRWSCSVYHFDSDSPSGVSWAAGVGGFK